MLIETDGYTGAWVCLMTVVNGFLFYAQDIHNDKE
jgi:hypothetical protein